MNKKDMSNRNERVLVNIYRSSWGISMTALIVMVALEVFMLIYSAMNVEFYGPYLTRYRLFYISLLTVVLISIGLNIYVKKDMEHRYRILEISNVLCAAFFFAWSLIVTYSDSMVTGAIDPSVFMTFSLTVPLSFYLLPALYAGIVIVADAVMLYLTASVAGTGSLINLSLFFVFQLVLGFSFLRLKVKLAERIAEEEENADVDVMTGLMNRRVYEEDVQQFQEESVETGLTYIALDINNLKDVNDGHGHEAGDRMIKGAAECMEKIFGERGRLYRIGGDEFVVLLFQDQDRLEELFGEFEKIMKAWSEANGLELSTSYGSARAADYPECSVIELARMADAQMYGAKARFYQESGRDRRRYLPEEADK